MGGDSTLKKNIGKRSSLLFMAFFIAYSILFAYGLSKLNQKLDSAQNIKNYTSSELKDLLDTP